MWYVFTYETLSAMIVYVYTFGLREEELMYCFGPFTYAEDAQTAANAYNED